MKIVICSMGYTGYAAACWKALARYPGVVLKIYTPQTRHGYPDSILSGLDVTIFSDEEFSIPVFCRKFADRVVEDIPDAILIGGWSAKPFKNLAYDSRLTHVCKLMIVDTMWEWNVRYFLSRFYLYSYVKCLNGIVVAGERGRMFARYIGFVPDQIFTSTYGYDASAFAPCFDVRMKSWPRRFVFVGRFAAEKGIAALISAYQRYRAKFGMDAWELHCYGKGPLDKKFASVDGLVNRGFLLPSELPTALTEAGVFVLPSLRDPWGVALAEGAGAGLPLIASDEVSSSIDLVRHLYNGYIVPAGNVDRLYEALCWMHEHASLLPEMGRRSKIYAGAYAPEMWAARILEAVRV